MKKGVLLLSISLSFALAVECKYYKVKEGDTPEKIAKSQGVDLKELLSANKGIDEKRLKIGQTLCIPVKKKTVERHAIYEVKKGDTLKSIADSFGVDVQTLKEYNNLKDDKLVEGQKLKIPARKASKAKEEREQEYEFYTVKRGGSLADVSKATGVPLKELERLNPELKGKTLQAGTKVKLPKSKEERAKKESYEIYTVKRGGKLEHVAKSTGVPLKELERLNPELKDKWLEAGTQVKVPKPVEDKKKAEEKKYEIYKVKRGAKLEHVSKATGVPLKELESLNPQLKDKWLQPGTEVKIPARETDEAKKKTEENYEFYTIKRSGRLVDVSKATGVPLKELERLNPELKNKTLQAGTKVKLRKKEEQVAKVQQEPAPSKKEEKSVVSELNKGVVPSSPAPKSINIQLPVEGKVVKVPKGVEIHAPCSSPVKAVEEGRVIYSGGDLQAYGNMIILEHDNFISLYAHNEVNLVRRGDRVSKGQVIAKTGKRSNTEECALRFELRSKEGIPLDPTEYLKDVH
ncbi:MAG: LysM peptidoglycan-binding domain-containing protein [Aquificaceae bacterium]|nr:LysM peptidoglycan-binding domain-containing protein [Aquificaceae bacterium]